MKILLTILSLFVFANAANAAETVGEKTKAKVNNVKREVKHDINKGKEMICEKTDKKCLAKKAKHRSEEAGDYVKDKVDEGKNVIDNDDK